MSEEENVSRVELYCGDCRDVLPTLKSNSVEMILADIPYGVVNRNSGGLRNLNKLSADEATFSIGEVMGDILRVCKGSIYIFCATEQVSELRQAMINGGLSTRLGVWEKTNPSPMNGQHIWLSGVECCVYGKKRHAIFNEHCKNTVWRFPVDRGKLHPTQKSLKLMKYLIGASSNPRDAVLDFVMGSGTAGVGCTQTNRDFIGIELDPNYFSIAKDRIEKAQAEMGGEQVLIVHE